MRISTLIKTTLPALLFAALLGCGSSGAGTMNVHLVDGPSETFPVVTIQISKLEIHGPTGWETIVDYGKLADDPAQHIQNGIKTIPNLRDLTGGIAETLAFGKSLPVGHYEQMRMILGPGNTVTLDSGSVEPLRIPSGMQTGLKFPVSFDVAPNTTRDVFIDFAANRSIFVHAAGNSGQYLLRPVVHAYDKFVTGAVMGKLTAADGVTPLGGVEVFAEAIQGGVPVVVRSTETASDGTYLLDLLPDGGTYYVVAQPVVDVTTPTPTTTVYEANASGPISITEAAATPTQNLSFTATTAFGTVTGSITSIAVAPAADEVVIQQDLGGVSLIIRSEPATVSSGETYTIANVPALPVGSQYGLAAIRGSIDAYGVYTEAERTTPPLDLTIVAGGSVTLDVTGM